MTTKILDGGLGTSLEDKYGVRFDHSRPLWSSDLLVSDPSTLLSCQRDFAAAGADVVLTATYQVSLEGFAGTRMPDFPTGIPASAVPPFLKTARLRLYDGSSLLSPSPAGPRRRLQYVAFETLPRLDEIRAVRKAFGAAAGGAFPDRFWIACVFPGDDERLPDGSTVEQAVEAMLGSFGEDVAALDERSRPWGIGINCTKLHKLEGLIRRFEDAVSGLIRRGVIHEAPTFVLYPDGTNGEVYNTTTMTWELPAGSGNDVVAKVPWEVKLAEIVQRANDRGVFNSFLVGGCCKANHENIKGLRDRLVSE
ncbi:homocysteine S-methyltransferase [Magnaporthiopsis poae ATCC 64411]|uniref:Homocysteine S-methyltransferase n=1 Tax=Magnaporthiopsis poae (strain ATCC 64411 / 73-15) TaxID=644358 RepID=A0A0C4DY28_MAGP6|nr:homocysteine S-methyltransferase [Magnaporthiopsis poae ATCC 64411]